MFQNINTNNTPTISEVVVRYREFNLPDVKITSPNGGEDWMKQSHYMITWESKGIYDSAPVRLYYSTDNGESWTTIGSWMENTGHYNWTVPNVETPSALIAILITDVYGNRIVDTSDASFAIDPPPPGAGGVPAGGGSEFPVDDQPGSEHEEPGGGASKANAPEGIDLGLALWIVILGIILTISIIFNLIYISKSKNTNKNRLENKKNKPKVGVKHEHKK
jgi:hypothetical protein